MKAKYAIPVISFVGAIAASMLVTILLRRRVPEAIEMAVGWWMMMMILYPCLRHIAWDRRAASVSRRGPSNFIKWIMTNTLVAVVLAITWALFN